MLTSMTAFARREIKNNIGSFTWEIRSVNHRYLEPGFRLPDTLREIEPALRERIRNHVSRGKLECQLKVQLNTDQDNSIAIDRLLAQQLINAIESIQNELKKPALINPVDILQWPGVIKEAEADSDTIQQVTLALFDKTLAELKTVRQREGAKLKTFIEQRSDSIDAIVARIRTKMPAILAAQKQKMVERLVELADEFEPTRLEQEMVFIAQKSDVDEELDRLTTHTAEVKRILNRNEPVGRRLDFLMQELNREANTLSSKSIVTDTTQAAVELKVLIEQMREQVQNIE